MVTTLRYQRKRQDDATVRQRLSDLAAERRRFGYRRLGWMLAREGHAMNHKKLYQLYHEEQLMEPAPRAQARAGDAGTDDVVRRDQPALVT
jgi:putative transposase